MEINPTICALIGFACVTLVLVGTVVLYRTVLVFTGQAKADAFPRRGYEAPSFIQRLQDAHANCVENLPLVAAVVLAAVATGQTALTDPLACYLLYARIGQSGIHALSVNHFTVLLRATLYSVQIGILVWWILKLTQLA